MSRRSDADTVEELGGIADGTGVEGAIGDGGPGLFETIGANVIVGVAARSALAFVLKWISAARISPTARAMMRPSAMI
jgi:hypothetical protein